MMIHHVQLGQKSPGRLYFVWFAPVEIAAGFLMFGIVPVYVGAWYAYPGFDTMWQATALACLFVLVPAVNVAWLTLLIRAFWRATRRRQTEAVFTILGLGTMGIVFVINAVLVVYAALMFLAIVT